MNNDEVLDNANAIFDKCQYKSVETFGDKDLMTFYIQREGTLYNKHYTIKIQIEEEHNDD